MTILKDFISFLFKPNFGTQLEIDSFFHFFKMILKSFLVILLINAIFYFGISLPLKYFDLFPSQKEVTYSISDIFKITLLIPIIEELIFRLPLKISKINIAVSLSLMVYLILNKSNIYLAVLISLLLFGFMLITIKKDSGFLIRADIFFTKYLYLVFYFQAFLYGFLHLTNYNLDSRFLYLYPLFIISYIFAGFYFGYIRIRYRYGIYLCIATHIIINSLYCLVFYK
jgi:hypothetical protein